MSIFLFELIILTLNVIATALRGPTSVQAVEMFFGDFTIPTLSFLYTNYQLWLFWNKRMSGVHALCASIIWSCLWGPCQLLVWLFNYGYADYDYYLDPASSLTLARLYLVFFLVMLNIWYMIHAVLAVHRQRKGIGNVEIEYAQSTLYHGLHRHAVFAAIQAGVFPKEHPEIARRISKAPSLHSVHIDTESIAPLLEQRFSVRDTSYDAGESTR
ncbi:hypothetical protein H2199_000036 [Coniosporium tulheliwenetii]|uniref:Uncharacterized protein n=1 Tax=Coniosporium tulheliwenetii TaxID=3383036 RepID=A0ACC2ZNR9_9PEZI|nr:hypothetical protein H2199_000036 [Cladosporium sp. JES 115]